MRIYGGGMPIQVPYMKLLPLMLFPELMCTDYDDDTNAENADKDAGQPKW